MNKAVSALFAGGLALSCGIDIGQKAAAAPASAASVKALLQGKYDAEDAAFAAKNYRAYFADCAPDYKTIESGGKSASLAQMEQTISMLRNHADSGSIHTTVQSVTLRGGVATAVVAVEIKLVIVRPSDGVIGHMVSHDVNRDVWRSTPSGWRALSTETLSDKSTMNGQPM